MGERPVRRDKAMKRANSSMQLTRAADYAVRVMIELAALPADARVSLPSLARATGAPESFLSKVLQSLTRAELITSQRGQSGGFRITQRGRQASMRDVIEAIDGVICLNVCLIHGRSCPRKARCPAHPVWARAQQTMLQVLAGASIAAMAAQASAGRPSRSASGLDVLTLPTKAARR
jgi:Rrf2 family protein